MEDTGLTGAPLTRKKGDVPSDAANCITQCSVEPSCLAAVKDSEGVSTMYQSFTAYGQQQGSNFAVKSSSSSPSGPAPSAPAASVDE
jgi:hypothetical protein